MGKTKIVVVGAGYGGLATAVTLQRKVNADNVSITLINKNDYHYETTWLHEAAAGVISANDVCYEIEPLLKDSATFVQATVEALDVDSKQVLTTNGVFNYDYLVVGLGFEVQDYGIPGIKEHAQSISNALSASKIWTHINAQFAMYEKEQSPEYATIVVGGAGFTGIEFIGSLVDQLPKLAQAYHIPQEALRVICAEADTSILPGFSESLSLYAKQQLEARGVEFLTQTAVIGVTDKAVTVRGPQGEEAIAASTLVWTAGVKGSAVIEQSSIPSTGGRVQVLPTLNVADYPEVFVVGDSAIVTDRYHQKPYPPTAQIAMQQGEAIANNLQHLLEDEPLTPFMPNLKGSVCSLGSGDGVALVKEREYTGRKAAVLKKMIDNHALFLVGGPGLIAKKGKFNIFK
ncbi:NAD(P)/FAD-dependent oxidoreductase [Kurthia populi]|uniref:NAD(P)/FAD-dependent oxidoreductase n=1 Tax=Kurthia populi TaxID=1562132 RepID=A0ABW5XWJ4_9BACL